jgi:hypothetical protein
LEGEQGDELAPDRRRVPEEQLVLGDGILEDVPNLEAQVPNPQWPVVSEFAPRMREFAP